MKRIYQLFLRLYPGTFRRLFEQEMLASFERLLRDERGHGLLRTARFVGREFVGLVAGACAERMDLLRVRFEEVSAAVVSTPDVQSVVDERELEQYIRFHLSRTIECIASHRFEGARFHAREEDRARTRLRELQQSRRS